MKPVYAEFVNSVTIPGGTVLGAASVDILKKHLNVSLELGPEGLLVTDKGKGTKTHFALIPMSNIKCIILDHVEEILE